ncbi:DUF5801 repeats-in-toxin domain-containing protein [Sphingomonas xanthus]|uniref:DUF5801 domain-containing protein n=1 Tax=Sphingomonas xanthus TaxID=2594473 RepID=A0A516IR23_9SPHN|nr:DUF5801 repeats-in-toxin domain-containing protein [Sphingomonas xanthus]QDP19352.1 hypothetical protein FMM02_04850 [Sphingomonas xanthus]
MRYEDSSNTGAFQGSGPIANDDFDALPAGSQTPATGNLITGEGTQTGSAGADSAAGGRITSITGKGGEDSSFAAGKLDVAGEFGRLSVDAEGNYVYRANPGVENVRDRFTYTLADSQGNNAAAALTIEIGKTPVVIQANAQQVVPGPDGVVLLPPGVDLSDIMIVGRNLVVMLPDGTQMIIVDGAIFVPQLVIDGVEVPASNVAALLIGQEPQPAAGESPPSSGGNFALPPPPLDPGVPLGDLIPPTVYNYNPPEVREVFDILDREPEIFIDPGNGVPVINAIDTVNEAGLPIRNGGEPAGSGEVADGNGSNNSDPSEATTGTIIYNSPDGVSSITLNGVPITAVGQVFNGTYGTLTITSIAPGAIGYNYVLLDNTSGDATVDNFTVSLTDNDGDVATATLAVQIVDDVPIARPDTDAVAAGTYGPELGNVLTGVGTTSGSAGADTVGADNATLTGATGAGATTPIVGGFTVVGQYGVLTISASGDYSYVRNPGTPGGVQDVFNYTLTDGDGDARSTTLTISIGDATPETRPNPTTLLDDDALPGGIPNGVGDDPDGQNTGGFLSGIGGDGPLSFNVLLTGAPAGFTYESGGSGVVLVKQGGVTVLTVTVNSTTGAYTVVQNAPIQHAAGGDENNQLFTINYNVTDVDGDTAPGTININVDDDSPEMGRADVNLPSLQVDETDLATDASADFSVVFAGAYGADGPGTTVYAVSTVDGTNSGLVDVATGLPVLLYNIGGQVVGSTSASLAGVTAGNTVFTASVNSSTGVVTLDQLRAVDHPLNPNPNDPVSPIATSIQLTGTITDADGDPASLAVNIGGNLTFFDDGPSVDVTLSGAGEPTLVTQDSETDGNPTSQDSATASFAANFSVNANGGADGLASQSLSYALGVSAAGVDSGLDQGGANIYLHLIGGVVVGSTSASAAGVNAGNTVFNVTVDGSGNVTLTQFSQIDHPPAGDPSPTGSPFVDHVASLTDSLVTLTATGTVTDGDGDTASDSQTLNIGANLQFQDDGPDVAAVLTGALLKLDETDGVGVPGEVDAPGGNLGTITVAAATLFTVSQPNVSADTPTTLSYSLALSADGVASGLLQSASNAPIYLYSIGGVVTGSTSATLAGVNAGNTAFTVSIDANSGAVTMTQFQAVEHGNTSSHDEDSSSLTAGVLSVRVNATDFDGDTDSASVDLGSIIRFEDDGPTIDVGVNGQVSEPTLITQDAETDGNPTTQDSASSAANFGGVFSLAFTTGSDGAATPTLSYALGVSAPGVDSGLDSGGATIYLHLIGGVVVGSTSASAAGVNVGNTIFDVGVSGAGVVTLTQYAQIDHPSGGDPSPTGSPFADHVATMADSLITLTASSTITDNDGDSATDSATVNIGANLIFQDDGPDVSAVLTGTLLKIDETDGVGVGAEVDPVGGDLGTVTVNLSSLVTISQPNVSADSPTTLSYSLVLSGQGVDSGLDVSSNNASIYLYNIGGQIVGSTAVSQAGVNAGNTAFTVSVNAGTGAVTITQFLAIEHPTPGASHDEDSLPIAAGALNLRVTATDFDGDTDFAQVDLGSVIRFEDDGPTAQNDVDVIVGGNGPATGNVLTGVEVAVGEDANNTDGVADNVGSDSPGSVTFIASNNIPANTDGTYTAGNLVVNGQYGTLTINANGDYSYVRTGGPGGVQDVFTYTLTDADGDTTTATLTISIEDNFPTLPDPALVRLDDDALAGGNADGPGDDVDSAGLPGQLVGSGGDGDLDYYFTGLNTLPAGFSVNVAGLPGSIQVLQGATVVLTVTLNNETGAFNVVQNNPILHPADNGGPDDNIENNLLFQIGVEVRDEDGDVEPATISINVDDDTPTINVTKAADAGVILTTDDAQTVGAATDTAVSTANFGGVFGLVQSAGADGAAAPAALSFALDVTGYAGGPGGIDSGLDQGGANIFLYEIGGKVVGSTSATLAGVNVGNTVFDVGVSATGVVTLTQYSQIDHPPGGDPSPTTAPFADHIVSMADSLVTLTASATLTDNDGDTVSDSETVNIGANLRFTDDGPSAAIQVTAQNVSLDESVGIQADSNDTASASVIALFAGVANKGVDTDLPQYATSASAIVTSTGSIYGADGAGTTLFGLSVAPGGVDSGLDTTAGVNIFLFNEGGVIVGRVGATAGVAAGGPAAFAIAINPATGIVSTVEYLSILHPNTADPDDSVAILNTAVQATVTITDFDGDTATQSVNIGSRIQFQDSGPVMTAASNINIQNSGDVAHTGTFAFNLGADDGPTNNDVIKLVTGSATVGGNPVQNWNLVAGAENATTASYTFSFNYANGPGSTALATGTLTFNKLAGTYTVDLDAPISSFSILQTASGTLFQGYEFGTSTPDGSQPAISVTQIQGTPGNPLPTDLFVQFTSVSEPASGTGDNNLEFTTWVPGADNPPPVPAGGDTAWNAGDLFNQTDGWVSTSNDANGVDGDTIQGHEVIDFTLVQGANPTGVLAQPASYGQASSMFLKFDGIGAQEDMIIVLKLYDPNTNSYTTRALMVQNADIQKGPGSGPGAYSAITLDNNDGLVIIESNDYNAPGENWVIVGAQIAGSDQGLTGSAINFNPALGAGGGSNTVGAFQDFSTDTHDGPFKISSIGFLTTNSTPQNAQLTFNVTVQDGDGDTVTQTIVASVTSSPDSSTPIALAPATTSIMMVDSEPANDGFSLAADSSNDNYRASGPDKGFGQAGNSGVMAGIVAAAGMQSVAGNAHGRSFDAHESNGPDLAAGDSFAMRVAPADAPASQATGLAADGESGDPGQSQQSTVSFNDFADQSGGDASVQSHGPAIPADLPHGGSSEAAAAAHGPTAAAPAVAMPGAEVLAALSLDVGAQRGGSVEQILADALGPDAPPTVDGLLAALGVSGPGDAQVQLASPVDMTVPAWDTPGAGAFASGFDMMIKMDAQMLHHDAVQPVING